MTRTALTEEAPLTLRMFAQHLRYARGSDQAKAAAKHFIGRLLTNRETSFSATVSGESFFIGRVRELHLLRELIKTATGAARGFATTIRALMKSCPFPSLRLMGRHWAQVGWGSFSGGRGESAGRAAALLLVGGFNSWLAGTTCFSRSERKPVERGFTACGGGVSL